MTKERKNKLPGLLLILALFCFAGSAEVVCKDSSSSNVGDAGTEANALLGECFPPTMTNAARRAADRETKPGEYRDTLAGSSGTEDKNGGTTGGSGSFK